MNRGGACSLHTGGSLAKARLEVTDGQALEEASNELVAAS